jgi:hypothetical protein
MSEPTVVREPAQSASRRGTLLRAAGGLGLVVVVALLALFVLRKKPSGSGEPATDPRDDDLQAAVAEADRLDPGWRFEELEQARAKVSDADNAAPLVLASVTLLPKPWNGPELGGVRDRLRKGLLDGSPRADLEPASAMLFEARKLADLRRGRHAVAWNLKDPLATPLPHLRATGAVVELLTLDAQAQAHEGDLDGALTSVRAALVAVHAIGDEPMLESQILRPGWHLGAVQSLEEVLRRGPGTEASLLAVQSALEDEASEPLALLAARAERAGLHGLMTALERGELTLTDLPPTLGDARGGRTRAVRLILTNDKLRRPEALQASHAWLLDYTTKFVEIARLPPEEQAPRLKELADTAPSAPPAAMTLLAGVPVREIGETCQKGQALLRCAAVGMALERYRLANGRWPDDLAALAPKYLAAVPADPFDGRPLHYARHKDVLVVYSVGPDLKDDGGNPDDLNRFDRKDGFDVGFRLWNVEARQKRTK